MRVRSETMARKLWAASGSLAAGVVFFADLTGEDFRDTIAAWAKDTVLVQWQKWEPSETFKEYHHKAAQNAPMGLVLGRGLGRRIGSRDPNYVAVPGLWRAKAIPLNYGFHEVSDLLGDLGFSEISIHGRHKGRKSNEWTFKTVRADGQAMLQHHVDFPPGSNPTLSSSRRVSAEVFMLMPRSAPRPLLSGVVLLLLRYQSSWTPARGRDIASVLLRPLLLLQGLLLLQCPRLLLHPPQTRKPPRVKNVRGPRMKIR